MRDERLAVGVLGDGGVEVERIIAAVRGRDLLNDGARATAERVVHAPLDCYDVPSAQDPLVIIEREVDISVENVERLFLVRVILHGVALPGDCLLYTSPSPRD